MQNIRLASSTGQKVSLNIQETFKTFPFFLPFVAAHNWYKWKEFWPVSNFPMYYICLSAGQAALPVLQHTRQGDRPHQVFPRVLLRMSEDALRHQTAEVPQVQLCLRRQWLSPHLYHLIHWETERWKQWTEPKEGRDLGRRRQNWRFI